MYAVKPQVKHSAAATVLQPWLDMLVVSTSCDWGSASLIVPHPHATLPAKVSAIRQCIQTFRTDAYEVVRVILWCRMHESAKVLTSCGIW
jgi:hypothetical protein